MKNFFFSIIIILTASAVLQQFLPWWIIVLPAFAVGCFYEQKSHIAFLSGFIAVFVMWSFYAFFLSAANDDILAQKVAALLPLQGKVSLLFIVTGTIGGLVSGFAALSGNLLRKTTE